MKILKLEPDETGRGWNDEDFETYQMDREIIKIEDANLHSNGYTFAVVTFAPVDEDSKLCYKRALNSTYALNCLFDTSFEGNSWEAEQ